MASLLTCGAFVLFALRPLRYIHTNGRTPFLHFQLRQSTISADILALFETAFLEVDFVPTSLPLLSVHTFDAVREIRLGSKPNLGLFSSIDFIPNPMCI